VSAAAEAIRELCSGIRLSPHRLVDSVVTDCYNLIPPGPEKASQARDALLKIKVGWSRLEDEDRSSLRRMFAQFYLAIAECDPSLVGRLNYNPEDDDAALTEAEVETVKTIIGKYGEVAPHDTSDDDDLLSKVCGAGRRHEVWVSLAHNEVERLRSIRVLEMELPTDAAKPEPVPVPMREVRDFTIRYEKECRDGKRIAKQTMETRDRLYALLLNIEPSAAAIAAHVESLPVP
jgi:hypothetical protein